MTKVQRRSALVEGCSLIYVHLDAFHLPSIQIVAMTNVLVSYLPYLLWATIHMLVEFHQQVALPRCGSDNQ
jgi:hypothetical protein